MWQLVRNDARRLWWLYLIALMLSVHMIMADAEPNAKIHYAAIIIFFMGIFAFTIEISGFGKFRVHTMLPVTTAQRGRAYSILFVVIAPAINFLLYLVGVGLHFLMPEIIPGPVPFLWYIAVVLFAMGFLSLFLQIVQLGIRFPYGWKKAIWELSSVAFLLVMLLMAIYFIHRLGILERDYFIRNFSYTIEEGNQLRINRTFSHIINGLTVLLTSEPTEFNFSDGSALGVALLCIILTFYKADSLVRYISWMTLQREQRHDAAILPVNNRVYGFFEPWIRELLYELRLMGILMLSTAGALFIVWLSLPVPLHQLYNEDLLTAPWSFILIVSAGLISIPPILPWFASLRSLRMLPLSRKALMFYLVSIPLVVFAAYSLILLIVCLYFKDFNYYLNLEWCLIVVFGFSMIANSLVLLSKHALLTFLALFCPTVAAILIFYSYNDPVETARQITFLYKAITGVALLAMGYAGLYVTLAYSLPYRAKPWFG